MENPICFFIAILERICLTVDRKDGDDTVVCANCGKAALIVPKYREEGFIIAAYNQHISRLGDIQRAVEHQGITDGTFTVMAVPNSVWPFMGLSVVDLPCCVMGFDKKEGCCFKTVPFFLFV